MAKKCPCQGKHSEFENFAKTQGIWFAQVVNSVILKVKDISKFAENLKKNLKKNSEAWWICQISFVYNSHKSHKLAQGKFAIGLGKNKEFENAIWVGTLSYKSLSYYCEAARTLGHIDLLI